MKQINNIDVEISSFEQIKILSEKKWESAKLKNCWGYQIQKDSNWRDGLNEDELKDFENQVGIKFPKSLKNYYRTMNGLNKQGINVSGNLKNTNPTFRSTFYSYPNDLELIKEQIDWVLEANKVTKQDQIEGKVPFVFPYFGHRFLIIDSNEQVLSMCGKDIVPWADNLSKAIIKDVFNLYEDEVDLINFKPVDYWLNELE